MVIFTRFVRIYDSSNIVELGWRKDDNTLVVTFVTQDRYQYSNITPAIFATIVAAPSVGKAFAQLVSSKQKGQKIG